MREIAGLGGIGRLTALTCGRASRFVPVATAAAAFGTVAFAGVATLTVGSGEVQAQSAQSRLEVAQNAPRRSKSKNAGKVDSRSNSNADKGELRQRIQQLEEQIVDLQVVVGTVESLAKSGGGRSRAGSAGGGFNGGASLSGRDAGRIAALETQVQALVAQLQQMSNEIQTLRAGGSASGGSVGLRHRSTVSQPGSGGFSTTATAPPRGGFGQTTVRPGGGDPIGSLISRGGQSRVASAGTAVSSAAAKQEYEKAYGHLLQQNYRAAESGFSGFLQRYPRDEMAANAQFWLGETYFVRGQWDAAAAAFLKVAQNHSKSAKAPDSLAKLAMALERKGNRSAACRALAELNQRYPNPPAYVKSWETAERRRAGCA